MNNSLPRVRVLVIDDEKSARQYVLKLLAQRPEYEVVGECRNGIEARQQISQEVPDLILLDIQMPGLNGFQVLEGIDADRIPATVFVTAFDTYAIRAFEAHAVGYLLKPFTPDKFWKSVDRARELLLNSRSRSEYENLLLATAAQAHLLPIHQQQNQSHTSIQDNGSKKNQKFGKPLSRLLISGTHKDIVVDVRDIEWIDTIDSYSQVHTSGQIHLIRQSLDWLESRLGGDEFVRTHRSVIVRIDFISLIDRSERGLVTMKLKNGIVLPVSRRKIASLNRILGRMKKSSQS